MSVATDIPRESHSRAAWVIYQLRLRGTSIAELARQSGVDRSTIRQALYQPSLPQEEVIANALNLTPCQLFHERYDARGFRLHRTLGRRKHRGSRQKAKADA